MLLLLYDCIYDKAAVTTHMPHVQAGLRYLGRMHQREPVTSTIVAIRQILEKIQPDHGVSTDLGPRSQAASGHFKGLPFLGQSNGQLEIDPCLVGIQSELESSTSATAMNTEMDGGSILNDEFSSFPDLELNNFLSGPDFDAFFSFVASSDHF